MTELFFVSENGQIEINWDSLELKTSKEFIERVKKEIGETGHIVDVFETDNYVNVTLVDMNYVVNISYLKLANIGSISVNMLNIYQIKKGMEFWEKKGLWS